MTLFPVSGSAETQIVSFRTILGKQVNSPRLYLFDNAHISISWYVSHHRHNHRDMPPANTRRWIWRCILWGSVLISKKWILAFSPRPLSCPDHIGHLQAEYDPNATHSLYIKTSLTCELCSWARAHEHQLCPASLRVYINSEFIYQSSKWQACSFSWYRNTRWPALILIW